MDPDFKLKYNHDMELATRELVRRSHDIIRVYNPLDFPFKFMYDRYTHTIPAKSEKDLERYLARHFFKKICDYMIGEQIQKTGNELKALREKQMGQKFLDKYEENVQIWDKTPKLNDPELINEIRKIVIIGMVEEFGYDEVPQATQEPVEAVDYTPLHDKIFDKVTKVEAKPQEPVKEEKPPVYVSKKDKVKAEDIAI